MPQEYKSYNKDPLLDGRFKFTPEQKRDILQVFKELQSYRGTVREVKKLYNITIDRKTIKLWINPAFETLHRQKVKERNAQYRQENRYPRAPIMRKYRAKKRKTGYVV